MSENTEELPPWVKAEDEVGELNPILLCKKCYMLGVSADFHAEYLH